jgi:peptidoglycan/LPS O-acetylase OafA/YrhL
MMELMKIERKKKITKLALWTWTWVASMAMATFGPKFIWDDQVFMSAFSLFVNFTTGIIMILANRDLFNHFDELERKVHLEAMALTLGLSVVFGLTFSLLDQQNFIPFEAEISYLVMFMGITYLVAFVANSYRFK